MKRRVISVIIGLMLCCTVSMGATATMLSVPIVLQAPYTKACWAASGTAVCQYYGIGIIMDVFAVSCGKTLNSSASTQEIQVGLIYNGISSTYIPQSSNFSLQTTLNILKAELDAMHPIVADVGSHAVVIRGYSASRLWIMDPQYEYYSYAPHSGFYS